MCNVPLALMAISVAKTGMDYMNTAQQAKSETKAIQANYDAQGKQLIEQQNQINQNALDKKGERAKEAMIERGRLRAIQGESGLVGNTQERIMGESYFNEGTDIASIESNRVNSIKQSNLDGNSLRASTQSQLNSVKQPSLIGAGLQIAGAGATYYQATHPSRA